MRVVIIYPLWSVTQRVSTGLNLFIIVTPATVRQVRKLQYLVTFFTIRVLTWVLLGKSLMWFCVTEMPFITFSNSSLQNKFWITSATGVDGRSAKLTAWKFGTVSWYTHSSDCALCTLFQCKLFMHLFTYLFIYTAVILSRTSSIRSTPRAHHISVRPVLILSFFLHHLFRNDVFPWSVQLRIFIYFLYGLCI
jgi:hypothetical protein